MELGVARRVMQQELDQPHDLQTRLCVANKRGGTEGGERKKKKEGTIFSNVWRRLRHQATPAVTAVNSSITAHAVSARENREHVFDGKRRTEEKAREREREKKRRRKDGRQRKGGVGAGLVRSGTTHVTAHQVVSAAGRVFQRRQRDERCMTLSIMRFAMEPLGLGTLRVGVF